SALTFHWPSEIVGCLPSQSAVVLVGADPLQTGDSTRDRRSFCPPLLCLCCGDETSNAQQTSPSRPHIYRRCTGKRQGKGDVRVGDHAHPQAFLMPDIKVPLW